ncbi:MAG TPA: transglutaminase-like domain-containing protein [Caulifigura sp.]|nr:transglutaminase-like domain-containing protein [Caulifigura sp.]
MSRRALLSLLAILFFALTSPLVADTPAKKPATESEESWQAIYFGKDRVGFAHVTMQDVERNGKKVFVCDNLNQMTINRFGVTLKMTVIQTSEEDSEGNMLGFKLSIDNPPNSKVESEGKIDGNKLTMTTLAAGRPKTTTTDWDPTVKSPAYIDRALQKEPLLPGQTRTFRMYDPQFSKVATITLTHAGKEKTKLLDGTEKELDKILTKHSLAFGLTITSYLDASGETVKTLTPLLPGMAVTTYAVTKEEALKEVSGGSLDIGMDTVIKTGPIKNAHTSKQAVYKVTIDGKAADAIPAGPTQAIKSLSDTEIELTVKSIKPGTKGNEPQPGPEYLASSRFLDLDDPNVKKLAEEGAAGKTDPVEVAVALENFVSKRLTDKNFSTALATASEVARDLAGDCTEHSVLLAALLRERKIPARVVIGFVYANSLQGLGGHMWTEAYLNGAWVPLDATLGLGGIGVGHIKVADADLSENSAAPVGAFVPIIHLLGKTKLELISVK